MPGIRTWNDQERYSPYEIVIGSDGNLYIASSYTTGADPTTTPSIWRASSTSTTVNSSLLDYTATQEYVATHAGGSGGLPTPSLTTGWQPGFGCSSGQPFTWASGAGSFQYPLDTAFTLENTTGVGVSTLVDDAYMHWDPASPKTWTVKQSGWYWYNYQIQIEPLGLASPFEFIVQFAFGLVNGNITRMAYSQRQLWLTDNGVGYINGGSTCYTVVGTTSGGSNTNNYNVTGSANNSVQMFLVPLF